MNAVSSFTTIATTIATTNATMPSKSNIPPEMPARLACRELTAGYGSLPALRGIDLALRHGELTAIIGPNGSGKSTLLHCLAGVLPPLSGHVLLDGEPLGRISPKARARRIAVLPQRLPIPSAMTAGDLALLGRYPHMGRFSLFSAADRQAALSALEALDAAHLAHRPLDELSGGELQRVFLARALAQEADILLLDEPAGAMDPARAADLFALLNRMALSGTCAAVVLHDINAAALFCHRVVALKAGSVLFDEPSSLLTSHQLSELYGTPLHAVAHPATGAPQFCLAAPGHVSDFPACPGFPAPHDSGDGNVP